MKKILSTLSAAAMLVAAVALVGCSNPASSETDTIRTIEAPVLSTETFPGVNYISWNKVNGAESYEVYRDGKRIGTTILSTAKVLEYADVAYAGSDSIVDGVSYEYTVKAIPAAGWFADESGAQSGNAARAVYSESNEASVTIKANVPTAAEFAEDYESYFEKFTGEDPDFKTEFVAVDAANNDYVRITLPTKPEFEYEVYKYLDNDPNKFATGNKVFTWSLYKAADSAREFLAPVTGAGDWNYIVKVVPRAPIYTSKEFAASAKVSVSALNATVGTNNYVSARYIDAGKTVKITWNPSKDATGKEYAAASYTVYRKADNAWTKLGEVASEKNQFGKNVYFVKDEVADNKVTNSYYVVLSEGKAYANENVAPVAAYGVDTTVNAATEGNPTAEYIDAGKTVRIVWQPKKDAADTLYGVDSYAVYRKDVGINGVVTYTAVSGKITATTSSSIGTASLNNTTDKYFVTDEPKNNKITNNYVVVLGGVYESATAPAYAYNVRTNPNAPTVSANKFAAEKTDTYQNDVYVTVTPGKSTDTFKLYRRLVSANGITISNVVDADWKEITGLTGPNENGAFVYVDSNLAEGTYQYKAIESAKDYADTAYTTTNVSIDSRTITGASISVSKYLEESLAASRTSAKFSIAVTDTIDPNDAAKFTYKVQYSKVEDIDPSSTTRYTFGAWTDVAPLAMVDTSISTTATTTTTTTSLYKGATNIPLGKGVYYFRVIKTDSNIAEPKYTYSGVWTVDAGFNTDSFSLGTTTAGTQVAITAANANYANYTVKLYKQQNINYSAYSSTNNNVSDFTVVAQSAFAPIAAGSTTYQATYGTYFTNAATALEVESYNYLLIVTDPEGNKTYSTLSNVTIK